MHSHTAIHPEQSALLQRSTKAPTCSDIPSTAIIVINVRLKFRFDFLWKSLNQECQGENVIAQEIRINLVSGVSPTTGDGYWNP